MKLKAFFSFFKGLSVAEKRPRPDSAPLTVYMISEVFQGRNIQCYQGRHNFLAKQHKYY